MMKHFSTGVLWRILVLNASVVGITLAAMAKMWALVFLAGIGVVVVVVNLYHYVTNTNRKLTRFLESVRYSDFVIKFSADNKMGGSFKDLNQQFNEVLEAFRTARAEKEANLQFINTIVQHVSVGLISFDAFGRIELINNTALKLLNIYRLRNLSELQKIAPELHRVLSELSGGGRQLYRSKDEKQLAFHATNVSLRGKMLTLVSVQNIQTELQEKELDAWQNLTKVLRHEIMNSVTPIVSLAGTMKDIVNEDIAPKNPDNEAIEDLRLALNTIENRGKGIMNFVNAYRTFTTIPKPIFGDVLVNDLVMRVVSLLQNDFKNHNKTLHYQKFSTDVSIRADADQIEMVLINLLKNALEAGQTEAANQVEISTAMSDGRVVLRVRDYGAGIAPEALEKIFIPFFTTKKTGSGIGLSLSRQIMQLHGGSLKVTQDQSGTVFSMLF